MRGRCKKDMTWQEIADAFVGVFTGFSPVYLLETVLIFLLVYYVFKVLKNNDACRLIAVYDGMLGGTMYTVHYAMRAGVELVMLNPEQ